MVRRIFVEKREGFNIPAQDLLEDFRETIGIKNLDNLRLFVRYDIEDLSAEDFLKVRDIVFCEPNADNFFEELPAEIDLNKTFAIEYLPGQFDQRADSAAQQKYTINLSGNNNIGPNPFHIPAKHEKGVGRADPFSKRVTITNHYIILSNQGSGQGWDSCPSRK